MLVDGSFLRSDATHPPIEGPQMSHIATVTADLELRLVVPGQPDAALRGREVADAR